MQINICNLNVNQRFKRLLLYISLYYYYCYYYYYYYYYYFVVVNGNCTDFANFHFSNYAEFKPKKLHQTLEI